MPRTRNPSKTWRLSIGQISYPTLPNEPEASDVGAPTENPEGNPAVKELLEKHAEQLKELKAHIEDVQMIHENEFNTAIQEANVRIHELTASLADKEEIIAFRGEKIQRLEKELAKKLLTFVESESEALERDNKIETSDQLEIRKVKTIVLSDPDEFIEKDEPRIDDWTLKIQSKLKRNAHLFSIEDVKIGYV